MLRDGGFEPISRTQTRRELINIAKYIEHRDEEGTQMMTPYQIMIRKTMRFVKCTGCDKHRRLLAMKLSVEKRAAARAALNAHNHEQLNQREYFQYMCQEAEQGAKWVMMIDGMDQSKCAVPHYKQVTVSTSVLQFTLLWLI